MYKVINSPSNKTIKILKSLEQKKYRQMYRLFFAEGFKVVNESLNFATPKFIVIRSDVLENREVKDILSRSHNSGIIIVNDRIFVSLSGTKNSQGIMAYYPFIHSESLDNINDGNYIFLDALSDPGNLGGIIRSAEAFNMSGVILSSDCVDLYSPKVVRATMASIFRMNLIIVNYRELKTLKNRGYTFYTSSLNDSRNIYNVKFASNSIVIIGNESQGVRSEIMSMGDISVKIPMAQNIDSLNANVAASIFMYEMHRQADNSD